jgi:hypothetical protein
MIQEIFGYLIDDAYAMAIGEPHSFERIINECKFGAILGGGWEHTRHPEESHVRVRRRGLQPLKVPLDTIFILHSVHRLSRFFLREDNDFTENSILQKSPENRRKYKEVLLSSSIAGIPNERKTRRRLCSSIRLGSTKASPWQPGSPHSPPPER